MDRQPPHISATPPRPAARYLPWHPLRPRIGKVRRIATILFLIFLCALIGGYAFLTDEDRIRGMAGDYLAALVGGEVHIGGAELSIFEGLRLDKVQLRVPDGYGPQSDLFDADTVFIRYDFRALLAG